MRLGLVLGAGGTVGLSYHAGVLRALERVGGIRPDDADLMVGTSAGSVAAAYLRAGWTTSDMWDLAMGAHPRGVAPLGPEANPERHLEAVSDDLFTRAFVTPIDLMRRGLGSAYVLSRSVLRVPTPPVPRVVRQMFPGGMFRMEEARRRFANELPDAWPEKALWLVSVDIVTGRRIVLGRPGSPDATLAEAVLASCAIPGVYQPVKVGRLTLVDGGAHSTSNLDLAGRAGCGHIIGIVPMAFDTAPAPGLGAQLSRRLPARALAAETAIARRRGAEVLLLRPTADEVRRHGMNLMRRSGWDRIAKDAYDATATLLESPRSTRFLSSLSTTHPLAT